MSDNWMPSPMRCLLWRLRRGEVLQPGTYRREVRDLERRGYLVALPRVRGERTHYAVTEAGRAVLL